MLTPQRFPPSCPNRKTANAFPLRSYTYCLPISFKKQHNVVTCGKTDLIKKCGLSGGECVHFLGTKGITDILHPAHTLLWNIALRIIAHREPLFCAGASHARTYNESIRNEYTKRFRADFPKDLHMWYPRPPKITKKRFDTTLRRAIRANVLRR